MSHVFTRPPCADTAAGEPPQLSRRQEEILADGVLTEPHQSVDNAFRHQTSGSLPFVGVRIDRGGVALERLDGETIGICQRV